MAAQDPNDAEYDEAPGLTRVGLKRIPVQVSNPSPSAPAAETRNGTMERYLVDLGEPADGEKIVVAVAQSSTVGTLRATTEVRAQKRVDAIGGLRLKELRLGCGFALDDEDIASDVIERSETLTVKWAVNKDEDAAPVLNVQIDPQSLAAAKALAEDLQKRHHACREPPNMLHARRRMSPPSLRAPRPSRPFCEIAVNESMRRPSFEDTLEDDDPEGTYSWSGDDGDVPIAFATLVTSSSPPGQAASSRRRMNVDFPPMKPPRRADSLPPPRRAGSLPPPIAPQSVLGRLLSTAFEGSSNEGSSNDFAASSSSAGHQQHQQRPPPPRPQRTRSQPPHPPLTTSRRHDGAAANRADDERDAGRRAQVTTGQTAPTAGPSRGATDTTASGARRAAPMGGGGSRAAPNIARSGDPDAHRPRPERGARVDRHGRASADLLVRPPPDPLPEKKKKRRREDASPHRPPTAPSERANRLSRGNGSSGDSGRAR